jgi:hypothetical protein
VPVTLICVAILLPPVIILVVTAFAFRLAVKSTSVIWLPLLWVVYRSHPGASALDRVDLNLRYPWTKVVLVYSLIILLAFCLKFCLIFRVWEFADLSWLGTLGQFATRVVAPLEIPVWQIGTAINAILAWAFYFRAKQHLISRNSIEASSQPLINAEYAMYQATRTALSLYAITCTLYIAAVTAWEIEWPPMRFILFPQYYN